MENEGNGTYHFSIAVLNRGIILFHENSLNKLNGLHKKNDKSTQTPDRQVLIVSTFKQFSKKY